MVQSSCKSHTNKQQHPIRKKLSLCLGFKDTQKSMNCEGNLDHFIPYPPFLTYALHTTTPGKCFLYPLVLTPQPILSTLPITPGCVVCASVSLSSWSFPCIVLPTSPLPSIHLFINAPDQTKISTQFLNFQGKGCIHSQTIWHKIVGEAHTTYRHSWTWVMIWQCIVHCIFPLCALVSLFVM